MKQLEHPQVMESSSPSSVGTVLALWQVNLLRVGYLVMGGGLAVFKWPLWVDGPLDAATREQFGKVLWVVILIAVIPWRFVLDTWITAAGDPGRRPNLDKANGVSQTG